MISQELIKEIDVDLASRHVDSMMQDFNSAVLWLETAAKHLAEELEGTIDYYKDEQKLAHIQWFLKQIPKYDPDDRCYDL